MKRFVNKKILFILGLFIFFILINCKSSFAYSSGDYVLSSGYNSTWIEGYMDLNQNPIDGIKGLIDKHQDYFEFTSADLGDYWVCEKRYYEGTEEYFYFFLIAPGRLYASNPSKDMTSYMFCSYDEVQCYTISFVTNGFYGSSSLLDKTTSGLSVGSGYTQHFTAYTTNSWTDDVVPIFLSNHDIYSARDTDKLVFHHPEVERGTTLAPVIQVEKKKGTLQVVLMEIILILPLIIVVVVSLVGLRKGLKMLFQLLHHS